MSMLKKLLITVIPVALMIGCAAAPKTDTPMATAEPEAPEAMTEEPVTAIAAPMEMGFSGHPLDDPSSLLAKRVIYFDFDKSDIRPEFRDIIAAHASYLSQNPDARVVLEGHADERGSREYNMGLGERRGTAASRFLSLQGAAGRQLEVVSFGEERPAALGHDESSWRLNRRVEIIYKSR